MPKNLLGGKKAKRGKNHVQAVSSSKKLVLAEDGQVYCKVLKKQGGSRLLVSCSDGEERSAIIPGRFRKKVWMNPDDYVLCELNATGNDDECYIIHKYSPADVSRLVSEQVISPVEKTDNEHLTFEVKQKTESKEYFVVDDTESDYAYSDE